MPFPVPDSARQPWGFPTEHAAAAGLQGVFMSDAEQSHDEYEDTYDYEEQRAGEEDEHERLEMPLCDEDREAMLDLAAAFTERPRGWDSEADVEQWPGVYMSVVDGEKRVTALEINSGAGPLSASLGKLEYLGALELAGLDIKGEFPSGLGWLRELRELTIENAANMAPYLPDSIDDLINLESIKIVGCPLWTLPESMGHMNQLESIVLRSCPISSLPDSLGNLAHLGWLVLSDCGLTGIPDFIAKLPGLQTLDLSGNRIGGVLPDFLFNLPLTSLNLSNNQFEGEIPASICKLTDLTMLDLSGNRLSGEAPACLAKIPIYNSRPAAAELAPNLPFLSYIGLDAPDDGDLAGVSIKLYGVEKEFKIFPAESGRQWHSLVRRSYYWHGLEQFYLVLLLPEGHDLRTMSALAPRLTPAMDEALLMLEDIDLEDIYARIEEKYYDRLLENAVAYNAALAGGTEKPLELPARGHLGDLLFLTDVNPVFTLSKGGTLTHRVRALFHAHEGYSGGKPIVVYFADGLVESVE